MLKKNTHHVRPGVGYNDMYEGQFQEWANKERIINLVRLKGVRNTAA